MSTIRRCCCPSSALVLCVILWRVGSVHICLAEQWIDSRVVGPLVCRAEFPLDELDGLFGQLAQIQTDLVRILGIRPAGETIDLLLFRNKASHRRYLGQYHPGIPYRRALFIKAGGPGKVLAYRSRQLDVDLRHECTHAFLHAALPMVPLWLDEGLAEYFEVAPHERAFDNPHLGSLRWSLLVEKVPRLGSLEKKGSISEMGQTEYRNAWAWVHFMLHGPPEAHQQLVQFLANIQGNSPPGLLSSRLQRHVPGLKSRFRAHFRSWKR